MISYGSCTLNFELDFLIGEIRETISIIFVYSLFFQTLETNAILLKIYSANKEIL